MAFDLTNLSPKDLDALISNAKQRKIALKKRKPIAAVREKLAKAAASEGYSLDELFTGSAATAVPAVASKRGAKPATKPPTATVTVTAKKTIGKRGRKPAAELRTSAGSKVAPKYRNPANPDEVWSGRGMTPRWMAVYLQQGNSKDDFLI